MAKTTPAMQQYIDIKSRYPDALVLFRMGDFYETFYEDAKKASDILGITLTARGMRNGAKIPLAGVPYHALDSYLVKLVRQGVKVVIVEQMEDPRLAKGVVKRDVVRIVTPGTVSEDHLLEDKVGNYIAAVYPGDSVGLALLELSTGEFAVSNIARLQLLSELQRWKPKEVLLPASLKGTELAAGLSKEGFYLTFLEEHSFGFSSAYSCLKKHFGVSSLKGYGMPDAKEPVCCAGALLSYLHETQRTSLAHVNSMRFYSDSEYMGMDQATEADLELVMNPRDRSVKNTLLEVLDHTQTGMGGRMLRAWMLKPLTELQDIERRLEGVAELCASDLLRQEMQACLSEISDLERLSARISMRRLAPRDLVTLRDSLQSALKLRALVAGADSVLFAGLADLDEPAAQIELISKAIAESASAEGQIIRPGYSEELDELRAMKSRSREYIRLLEEKERRATGIKPLKIGYNRVFGYFLEVPRKWSGRVPGNYIRKQTTANGERYATEELKTLEEKILHAEERIDALENQLYQEVVGQVASSVMLIQDYARALAVVDALASLAWAAKRNRYCRPRVTDGYRIALKASRHPVLEQLQHEFVPNDIELTEEMRVMILTGPNMAGKSTLMRQTALSVLMAQMGSFVAADSAEIAVADRLYTRVGAHDDISRGQSTFMVEMSQVASILNTATERSFVVLDEMGRGTSTFDGVSIAWAVAEHLITRAGCKTMVATHYHVLSKLGQMPGAGNYNMAVREDMDEVIFLRKLLKGECDRSYGIHVARLAGMPKSVIMRAKEIQFQLEEKDRMRERIIIEKRREHDTLVLTKSTQKTLNQVFEPGGRGRSESAEDKGNETP